MICAHRRPTQAVKAKPKRTIKMQYLYKSLGLHQAVLANIMAAKGEAAGVARAKLAQTIRIAMTGMVSKPMLVPMVKINVANIAPTTMLLATLVSMVAKNSVRMIKIIGECPARSGCMACTMAGRMPVASEVKMEAKGMTKHMMRYISHWIWRAIFLTDINGSPSNLIQCITIIKANKQPALPKRLIATLKSQVFGKILGAIIKKIKRAKNKTAIFCFLFKISAAGSAKSALMLCKPLMSGRKTKRQSTT